MSLSAEGKPSWSFEETPSPVLFFCTIPEIQNHYVYYGNSEQIELDLIFSPFGTSPVFVFGNKCYVLGTF